MNNQKTMNYSILYKNNHVSNIYEACTCCYNNTKPLTYQEKKEYIQKRINAGHESILEHGKLAIKIKNITNLEDLVQLTTSSFSKYLEFYSTKHTEEIKKKFKKTNTITYYNLIVNGNMRSYKYFLNTITDEDMNNSLIQAVYFILINNTVKELYGTSFKLSETPKFVDIEYFNDTTEELQYDNIIKKKDGIEYQTIKSHYVDIPITNNDIKSIILGIDSKSVERLMKDKDVPYNVIFHIIPITIVFRNMSRTTTHQLVRHRNAVTQESQRYVDYSNASFTIPIQNYDPKKKYNIKFNKTNNNLTLEKLAKELISVYSKLMTSSNNKIKKEEARGFLPSNVNCNRLYMTFTLFTLFQFIKLRTDPHAQYEIREYANTIKSTLINETEIGNFISTAYNYDIDELYINRNK